MRRFVTFPGLFHHEFMRIRRALLPLLAAVLLLAACGSDSGDEPVEPAVVESTSTTIDIRSRAIPDNPDVAYVTAVLTELERVRGDIRRDVYATHSVSSATLQRLSDIYGPEQRIVAERIWTAASIKDHPDQKPVPPDSVIRVDEILDSSPECLVVKATDDSSGLFLTPKTELTTVVFFLKQYDGDNRSNPTPWKYEVENKFRPERIAEYKCDDSV
jgi:hypothetical protein